jgi:hypothetical protein
LLLAFTCAIFSYYFIERPFLNLKFWLSTPRQKKPITPSESVISKG